MKIRWFLFAVLAVPAMSMTASAFDRESLVSEWEWVREDPDDWRLQEDGALRLRTQPGVVWGARDDAENVLVRKTPAGGGSAFIEATVTLEEPVHKFEQAGLLVYVDDRQFVKLIVEFIDGEFYVVMAREFEKKGSVVAKIATGAKTARLRYEVEADRVKGLFKTDLASSEWQEAAVTELPSGLDRRFALFTQSGPPEESRWATIRDVQVKESKAGE
jgi:regulation of enolase protein 1 (concanavalin A-like superfamily)